MSDNNTDIIPQRIYTREVEMFLHAKKYYDHLYPIDLIGFTYLYKARTARVVPMYNVGHLRGDAAFMLDAEMHQHDAMADDSFHGYYDQEDPEFFRVDTSDPTTCQALGRAMVRLQVFKLNPTAPHDLPSLYDSVVLASDNSQKPSSQLSFIRTPKDDEIDIPELQPWLTGMEWLPELGYKNQGGGIQLGAGKRLDLRYCCTAAFKITEDPIEDLVNGTTYRSIWVNKLVPMWCAAETRPEYRYLDKGNYVFVVGAAGTELEKVQMNLFSTDEGQMPPPWAWWNTVVVTDKIIPTTAQIIVCCQILDKETVTNLLVDGVFIPSEEESAATILANLKTAVRRAHSGSMPTLRAISDYVSTYLIAKCYYSQQFEELQRVISGEQSLFAIANFEVTSDKLTYGTVTFEQKGWLQRYSNISHALIMKANSANGRDVYVLINQILERVCRDFERRTTKSWTQLKEFKLSINSIPIHVKRSSRGVKVNDVQILKDELLQVLAWAACCEPGDTERYARFLSDVSKISLTHRHILDNGLMLPVTDDGAYVFRETYEQATTDSQRARFSRLNVKLVDGKYELVGPEDTPKVYVHLTKLQKAIQEVVEQAVAGQTPSSKNREYAIQRISEVAIADAITPELTQHVTSIVDHAGLTYRQAIKLSEELLADVAKSVGASWLSTCPDLNQNKRPDGLKDGCWKVKSRTSPAEYLVSPNGKETYEFPSGEYVCIINGNVQAGIGADAVATRLVALYNDARMTGHIHTLRKHAQ